MRGSAPLVALGLALALVGAGLPACGAEATGPDGTGSDAAGAPSTSHVAPEDVATFDQHGPHAVEQVTVTVEGPQGPDEVRIWAPGNGDGGPWPLLVYAHGINTRPADHDRELAQDAGHLSFSSVCARSAATQRVRGEEWMCASPEVGEEALWPAIDHTIVAFLRWATGQDPSAAALSQEVIGSLGAEVTVRGSLDGD